MTRPALGPCQWHYLYYGAQLVSAREVVDRDRGEHASRAPLLDHEQLVVEELDVEERGVARGVARVLVVSHVEYPPLDVESELREVHLWFW